MELREKRSIWERLAHTERPIVLYGMGDGADKILDEMARRGLSAAGVFASDEFCKGQQFRGFPVLSYAQAKERFGDMVVLVAFGTQRKDVMMRIKGIAQEQELFAPDMPVCGRDVFDPAYCAKHRAELEEAYGMLADERSRRTFLDIVDYKISGKIKYLFECESSAAEAYQNILRLGDQECYVDAGAYTGDTLQEFLQHTRGYRRITAIEPDARNFRKLQKNVESLADVECLHCAAWDRDGEIAFAQRGGRNSAAASGANNRVRAARIDTLLKGRDITYIKYDVEGMEQQALLGTQETIRRWRPKLMVSAYHKRGDLFRIPLQIKEINGDYRVYLRHFPYIPAWDTNYYFI